MKRKVLNVIIGLILLTMVGCSGETTTELVTQTPTTEATTTESVTQAPTTVEVFDNYITLVVGDDTRSLGYNDDQDVSVLDLIEASDILIEYTTSEYGAMVSAIGSFEQDDFHWIGFTKNDEFAMSGLDSIDYQDGDVFEFTENLVSWETNLEVDLSSIDLDYAFFSLGNYTIQIEKSDLSEPVFVGESYLLTGTPQSEDHQVITYSLTDLNPSSYTGYIEIKLGDNDWKLMYDEQSVSVLDLIEASDIMIEYTTSEYGAMVSSIGSFQQDDFHWIGFTKNDEFAMSGIDSIDYTNGDVFEFTENLVSWEISISAELTEINNESLMLVFENNNQTFVVNKSDLPEDIDLDALVVGFVYQMEGMPDIELSESLTMFNPSVFALDVIDDFTLLYDLEEGDIFLLEFTVTYIEESSAFGSEIFASDSNGLLSKDISGDMAVPSQTDYIFYTIPDRYELTVGQTYIGRFIYQVNAPSSIPQLTIYEESINGDPLIDIIVEE